jgi:hypothetical protein
LGDAPQEIGHPSRGVSNILQQTVPVGVGKAALADPTGSWN